MILYKLVYKQNNEIVYVTNNKSDLYQEVKRRLIYEIGSFLENNDVLYGYRNMELCNIKNVININQDLICIIKSEKLTEIKLLLEKYNYNIKIENLPDCPF